MLKIISKVIVALVVVGAVVATPTTAFAGKKIKEKNKSVVPTHTQIMPTFEGQDCSLFNDWLLSNIQYPQRAKRKKIGGKVIISFLINEKGIPANFEVMATPDELLSDAVIRAIKSSPRWVPASKNGTYIPVKLAYTVTFNA